MVSQFIVGITAIAWCFLHSFLITPSVEKLGVRFTGSWYRFLYVLTSCLTLGIAFLIIRQHQGEHLYSWLTSSRYLMVGVSASITLLAISQYDNQFFLGISQIRTRKQKADFSNTGILNYMRHPYYAAGIIFVTFYDDFTTTSIVWRGIFVLYFLIGAKLEEKKLLDEHGQTYADYMEKVPAFGKKWRR
jgi:methanethiol S-methyltransferase